MHARSMNVIGSIGLALSLSACGGSDSAASDGAMNADGSTTGPHDPSLDDGSVQALCVNTINMYRATLGLPAYARWSDAESCTDGEAESDSMSGKAHGAFGACKEHAQDECPGWPAPPETMIGNCLAQMWAEGPGADFSAHGHYLNMSSTQYTMASCGFHTTGANSVWAVQNFK